MDYPTTSELLELLPFLSEQERAEMQRLMPTESELATWNESQDEIPPAPRLTLLQWTEQHRFIQNKATREIARFGLGDYPWLEPIYNEIGRVLFEVLTGERAAPTIYLRKGAQLGVTEFALNVTWYGIDCFGLSVFYALPPGHGIAGDFAHTRVDPAIAYSPRLQEIAGDIGNVGLKMFRRGVLYLRGTHIPGGRPDKATQLASVPADMAIVDEWDRIPPAAIPLIRDRLGDSRYKLWLGLSTPTYPGIGIDAEYQETDQREPQIRCQACGAWNWLTWDLVAEREGQVSVWCPDCQGAIDRATAWEQGRLRFTAREPDRAAIGYWLPKLISPRASLAEMWAQSQATNEAKILAFWNNAMGLPYEPKGARLTLELLRACMGQHLLSDRQTATWSAMGVDVGLTLHVWIIEGIQSGIDPNRSWRAWTLYLGEVAEWDELDGLMARYGVGVCVVDAMPERRLASQFAQRHPGKVFLATYVEEVPGAEWCQFDVPKKRVRIERTTGLDRAHENIAGQRDVLPRDFEAVPGFVEQMTANLKVKGIKPDETVFYHFPRTGKPDHYDHAKVYCEAAMERLQKLRPPDSRQRGSAVPRSSKKRSYRGRL